MVTLFEELRRYPFEASGELRVGIRYRLIDLQSLVCNLQSVIAHV